MSLDRIIPDTAVQTTSVPVEFPWGRPRKSVEVFEDYDFDRILDIGCHDGQLTSRLADASNADAVGMDISDSVRRAADREIEAVRADADGSLPFRDGVFDAVYVGEVIDYLNRTTGFLREVYRVLDDGGILVLTTPNLAALPNRVVLLFGRRPFPMRPMADNLSEATVEGADNERVSIHTRRSMEALLRGCGFDVLTVEGACSALAADPAAPLALRALDILTSYCPNVSYRNVFVATPNEGGSPHASSPGEASERSPCGRSSRTPPASK